MYCAYIVELKSLREHSNADRLLCTEVFGNNVIVSKDYYKGQKCIFFPTDGKIGLEFAEKNNLVRKKDENGNNIGGYLDPDKRNVTALKLRGEKSEGLLLPIESLQDFTDINDLKVGDTITVLNGITICEKYIPRRNQRSNSNYNSNKKKNKKESKEKVSYPFFEEHVDTAQLAYNMNAFKPGDTIYLTRKLHGTSARTSFSIKTTRKSPNIIKKILHIKPKIKEEWELVSGTRRTVLKDYDGGYYGTNQFRRQYHDFFKDKLPKGFEVFYEIVGYIDGTETPIMGKCSNKLVKDKAFEKMYGKETVFNYGCEVGHSDFYVYRITHTSDDGVITEVPWEVVKIWCERWGCKHVPELEKFLYTTWEDLNNRANQYLDQPESLANGSHVCEGVVARIDNREKFTAYKQKGFFFKCLEGIIKDNSDAPDMEEAEELIAEEQQELVE